MNKRNMMENSSRMMTSQQQQLQQQRSNYQTNYTNENEYVTQQNMMANHQIYMDRERIMEPNPQQQYTQQSQQQIQVQILPQDDNWGDNTTAMNGDFSDFNDDMTEDGRSFNFNPPRPNINEHTNYNNKGTKYNLSNQFNHNSQHNNKDFLSDINNYSANQIHQFGLINAIKCYISSYFGFICTLFIMTCSFLTPIMFIILPRLNLNQQWAVTECGLECEAILIGIAFKMFLLFFSCCILFGGRKNDRLPRLYEMRLILIFLLLIMTFSFWLFYGVRIIDNKLQDYHKILQFAASYVDVLLIMFVISVFIIEMRHLRPQYVVRIVRSPDGQQNEYLIGKMSIQRAALWILEQYYKDFNVYNPWLENAHRKKGGQLLQLEQANEKPNRSVNNNKKSKNSRSANISMTSNRNGKDDTEDMDDDRDNNSMISKKTSKSNKLNANNPNSTGIVGGNFSANDRFYEEYEYERRLRKRRARLLTSTEEAFTHIRRVNYDNNSINKNNNGNMNTIMDPYEAAQAIFTSIARDLRRYLRVTRQQPFYNRETIIKHLADCISYDMSPKSFLQRYLVAEPLMFNQKAMLATANPVNSLTSNNKLLMPQYTNNQYNLNVKSLEQSWILISDTVLYQNVEDTLMFVLKQNEVTLMCTFKKLPRFNLIEDIIDPKRNKFMLKLNSETTV